MSQEPIFASKREFTNFANAAGAVYKRRRKSILALARKLLEEDNRTVNKQS